MNQGGSVTLGNVQWGPDRYPSLWLYIDGDEYSFMLHRLSAYAHGIVDHPRFDEDPREVHHKDEDKWNSHPDNLEALEPRDHALVTNGVADE